MAYIIDQLVEKHSERPVQLSEIVTGEDRLPSTEVEFVTRGKKKVYKVFSRDDFVKDSDLKFKPVHVHRGSKENTPFPTYNEVSGNRELATEKVIHYIYELMGEGMYNYRWMGGQNPRMEYLLQRKYIKRIE